MALVLADRVRETSTSTGTTTITLGGAYTGFQTFSATVGNGNTTYYTIANVVTGEWEVGIGTYTSSGNTLSRDTVLASSNSGSLVNFTSGSKDVFITQPSERAVYVNGTSIVAANNAVLGTANGGTGITSFGTGVATALGTNVGTAGSFVVNGGALGTPSSGTVTNLTGTASININGTVGATTPTTGAFTTLSASSTVTLSGGTANGVAYLNGSKVLTTGSALTFDGGNLGLGVTPSAWSLFTGLQVGPSGSISNNGTATPVTVVSNNAYYNGTSWAYINTAAASQYQLSTSQHIWRYAVSGSGNITWSEAMRLDASGNLGVGTTSPSSYGKFAVVGSGTTTTVVDSGSSRVTTQAVGTGGSYTQYYKDLTPTYVASVGAYNPATSAAVSALVFADYQGGWTERARIDSSGNLLVGTTTATEKITVNGRVACQWNAYANGGTTSYSGDATSLVTGSSAGMWAARSDSALLFSISSAEKMRIDSSGNLGLGVTPNTWASTAKAFELYGGGSIYANASSNDLRIGCNVYISSAGTNTYKTTNAASFYYQAGGTHYWFNAPSGTAGSAITFTQAMTLNSSGYLGIGTTSPAVPLHVVGNARVTGDIQSSGNPIFYSYNGASAGTVNAGIQLVGSDPSIRFSTNNAERMRLDGSGKLYFGLTAGFSKVTIQSESTYGAGLGLVNDATLNLSRLDFQQTSTGGYTRIIGDGRSSGYLSFVTNDTERARIDSSGNLLVATTASTNGKLTILKNSLYNSQSGHGIALLSNDNNAYTSMYMGADDTSNIGYIQTAQHNTGYARDLAINPNGGNLLVGTTATVNSCKAVLAWSSSTQNGITFDDAYTGAATANPVYFRRNGSNVGTISTTTTTTAYNTSSDYRLKNVTGNLTGYKERVMSLQPRQGTWKIDGSEFRGFLAHEFAGPYRSSVTGEKDAVDADGNPVMQAMQASSSEVMADLVALVQELVAENQSLKARLDAANL